MQNELILFVFVAVIIFLFISLLLYKLTVLMISNILDETFHKLKSHRFSCRMHYSETTIEWDDGECWKPGTLCYVIYDNDSESIYSYHHDGREVFNKYKTLERAMKDIDFLNTHGVAQ